MARSVRKRHQPFRLSRAARCLQFADLLLGPKARVSGQTTSTFLGSPIENNGSEGTLCDTPAMPRRKNRLRMPVSRHLKGFETPATWPRSLMHLLGGICRNPQCVTVARLPRASLEATANYLEKEWTAWTS